MDSGEGRGFHPNGLWGFGLFDLILWWEYIPLEPYLWIFALKMGGKLAREIHLF